MLLVAIVAGTSFLIAGTMVGVKLLRLAHRTRGLPEFLLGAGLCSLTFVTLPFTFLSLGAHLGSYALQLGLFAAGLTPIIGFAMCLYGFTALVFRPGESWAKLLVALAGLAVAIGVIGTVATRFAAWDEDRVVAAEWSVLLVAPFVLGMIWTGGEALQYHLKLRRRVPLGLADPVVCDRFRLWAIGNLGGVAGTSLIPISLLLGWRVVAHPVPILGIAIAGFSLSAAWYLAFLPPATYLDRVRTRYASANP